MCKENVQGMLKCSSTVSYAASFSSQGIVYGKPASQGITQLKPTRNLRNIAEERVGRKVPGLRVLNSYWVNEVGCNHVACLYTPRSWVYCLPG